MRRRALAAAALGAAVPARPGEPPIAFVDAHVHLNDPVLQIELMDRHGADRAVVFWGGRSDNDTVLDAVRRWPGRFVPFVSISPEHRAYRTAWQRGDVALLDELDALLAGGGGWRGIGEISSVHFPSPGFPEADFDPGGAITVGILALARKHRVPVLLHIELTRLAAFSALLERFADVPVIWAHGGYTPLFIAARMLERHANLHYELSARTWPRHPRSPEYTLLRDGHAVWPEWLSLIEAAPQRFIVGTDASGRSRLADSMKFESVQNLLRQLKEPARRLVARENILRLVE